MEKQDIKTFQDVLAWTIELREQMAENDRRWAESRKQLEEERIQQQQEYKRQQEERNIQEVKWQKEIKKIHKEIAEVTGSHGREAEYMFYRSLKKHLKILGFSFDKIFIHVQAKKNSREYDMILVNGDYIALVEVKRTASKEDVLKLVNEQAKDLRTDMTEYKDKKIICVLAAYICIDEVIEFAKEMGICILLKDGIRLKTEVGTLKYF